MISAQCPYCYQPHTVADVGPIKCTACGNFFDADALAATPGDASPTLAPPVHVPSRLVTRLTEPHHCHQCNGAILEAAGLQRSTRLCPLCHKKTSIYARLYFCSECRMLLESPVAAEGKRFKCPKCERALTVPRELAFQDRDAEIDAGWFAFPCPACNKLLHSRRDCARELTFCPACRQIISIPDHGFAEPPRKRHLLDEPDPTTHRPMRRCPRCQMPIPLHAGACPYCSPIA